MNMLKTGSWQKENLHTFHIYLNFACCRGEPEPFINGLSLPLDVCKVSHASLLSSTSPSSLTTQKMAPASLSHGSVMRYSKLAKREMEDSTKSLAFLQVAWLWGGPKWGCLQVYNYHATKGWSYHIIPLDTSPTLDNEFMWKTQREKYKQIPSLSLWWGTGNGLLNIINAGGLLGCLWLGEWDHMFQPTPHSKMDMWFLHACATTCCSTVVRGCHENTARLPSFSPSLTTQRKTHCQGPVGVPNFRNSHLQSYLFLKIILI